MYGYEINKTEFEKLLEDSNYHLLIPKIYYSDNQEEILNWCMEIDNNNFVPILYFIIRHYSKNNLLYDSKNLDTSIRFMFRAIYLCVMHISVYKEINKEFPLLHILCNKMPEKIELYTTEHILYDAYNREKDYITKLVESLSEKICPGFTDDHQIPDPYFIYNTRRGYPSYPAICVDFANNEKKEEIRNKFINNFGGRIQRYYNAILYCNEKFRTILNEYDKTRKLDLSKHFLT
jgi:hypothetical protein